MPAPLEIRYYLAEFTAEHLRAGVQPVQQVVGDEVRLFVPPQFQVRWREKDKLGALYWSDWTEAKYVRQGVDDEAQP